MSASFHLHPFLSIAFQNIWGDGYTHVSSVPAFGMLLFCRSIGKLNGWSETNENSFVNTGF